MKKFFIIFLWLFLVSCNIESKTQISENKNSFESPILVNVQYNFQRNYCYINEGNQEICGVAKNPEEFEGVIKNKKIDTKVFRDTNFSEKKLYSFYETKDFLSSLQEKVWSIKICFTDIEKMKYQKKEFENFLKTYWNFYIWNKENIQYFYFDFNAFSCLSENLAPINE